MFKEQNVNLNIEFIDICFGLQNGFKPKGNFYLIDNNIPTDERLIHFLKSNLKNFGFQIENVLGKGNYGVVFAAKSEQYGNVAIKIAANTDGVLYDFESKQECCYHPIGNCDRCSKPVHKLVPFEVANAIFTHDADGVVRSKAFGIISTNTRLLFYILVMEKIENSMTLLSFTQKCFKKFNKDIRKKYIKNALAKLNEINMNLINNQNIFHNDLKSDNILVKVKDASRFKKCGSGRQDLEFYLIDFGNAILNVDKKDHAGNFYMSVDQAPDVSCQQNYVNMAKMLSWYLGVIGFEMCSNGIEKANVGADANVCHSINSGMAQNSNSFDHFINKNYNQKSLKLCYENFFYCDNYYKIIISSIISNIYTFICFQEKTDH
ncbi:hypothetical protein BpHYR1_005819 [Brachionus plicatilis]|uniref:Protein kinase domain-containing protein n=1 Tax=Brachionus plicatilis TaxID=10195 RepID=A0A3M7SN87_BRAPC|nr:hypothetical protein BpHYR1_005819 [Brachionus plicatilis]